MPPPPPAPPSRGGPGGDLDEPSLARLSLRPIRTAPSPPIHNAFQFPVSYASVVRRGLPTCAHLLYRLPTFGSQDSGKWHSSDNEDDSYFESLVNNFIIAANDACKPPKDNIDKKASTQRQSDRYAESALKYYNNDKDNKVKYDLISAITSCGIVDRARCYGHVNFIAKGNQENSKEELFFAELRLGSHVPTCVVSLEGAKIVGGLRGSKYDGLGESKYDRLDVKCIYIDAQHCYGCGSKVKHPKNGALYQSGHVACSGFYHG
nr:unnamed protein product [Digitaria exilis]